MDFDYKQFVEWLNGEGKPQQTEVESRLLVEAKLSKYWKFRAARRAKNANRPWPNKDDRDWALEQQSKSEAINTSIQSLFQKELEESEDMINDVTNMMRKIKKIRKKMKMEREGKLINPKDKVKKKKSLSKPYPPHKKGETVSGYYKKAAKKLGGAAAAPGETIGPLEEEKASEQKGDLLAKDIKYVEKLP